MKVNVKALALKLCKVERPCLYRTTVDSRPAQHSSDAQVSRGISSVSRTVYSLLLTGAIFYTSIKRV